ncbi:MAG: hypothetical protein ACP5UU_05695 [Thermoprotei archaeon]
MTTAKGDSPCFEGLLTDPHADDYRTAWHRVSSMVSESLPSVKKLEIVADGTKLKTGSAGEYLTYRYGRP